jgi:hypothetical protein
MSGPIFANDQVVAGKWMAVFAVRLIAVYSPGNFPYLLKNFWMALEMLLSRHLF